MKIQGKMLKANGLKIQSFARKKVDGIPEMPEFVSPAKKVKFLSLGKHATLLLPIVTLGCNGVSKLSQSNAGKSERLLIRHQHSAICIEKGAFNGPSLPWFHHINSKHCLQLVL